MLKLKANTPNGPMLVLGLSDLNIDRLKAGFPIKFDMAQLGGEGSMMIFAGTTEEAMVDELVRAQLVAAETGERIKAAQQRAKKGESMQYPARFTPQDDVGGYVVTFRDIPEALSQGEDEAEALREGQDALETAFDFYYEDGRPIPEPSAPEPGEYMVPVSEGEARCVRAHNARLARA